MKGAESPGSSTTEQIAAVSAGDVLRDRGRPVKIDTVLDLGLIDFGSLALEFWDPVPLHAHNLTVNVPTSRAHVIAALSETWARCIKVTFSDTTVAHWRKLGETSALYGTLVLSREGPREQLAGMDFWSGFFDEVFDEAFDPSNGAAIIDLKVRGLVVPMIAWHDCQKGGALFRGDDASGSCAALLFDAVRLSAEDAPE